jgi:hypothetical protein
LRNEFAHSRRSFKFTTPEVKAVCDELKIPDLQGAYIPPGLLQRVSHEGLKDASDSSHPKTRYIMACENLIFRMLIVVEPDRSIRDAAFSDDPLP